MHSPNQKTFIRIGAPNDPSVTDDDGEGSGILVQTGLAEATHGVIDLEAGVKCEIVAGEYTSWVLGGRMWFTIPFAVAAFIGGKYDLHIPKSCTLKNKHRDFGVNEFEVALDRTRAHAVRDEVAAMDATVAGDVQRDILAQVQGKNDEIRVATDRYHAMGNRIATTRQNTTAVATDATQQVNKMQFLERDVRSIGIQMHQTGSEIRNGMQRRQNTATIINNTVLKTKTAAQSMQTAAMNLLA